MDQSQLQPFPLSRFINYSRFNHYYPFGNTLAEDFLQSVADEAHPSILSLGCGDIRSCFYTLWKHFSPESESNFTSVHFVLNDRSSAVLARNVLFLSLCLTMPEDDATSVRTREWLASFWSIWYNHELLPKHREVLVAALARLVEWSESRVKWSKCELGSLVQFTSDTTLKAIRKVWLLWKEGGISVAGMQNKRSDFLLRQCQFPDCTNMAKYGNKAASLCVLRDFAYHDVSPKMKCRMIKDFAKYIETGSVFAELAFDLSVSSQSTTVNMTLFECENGSYTLSDGLVPYLAFTEIPQYSPKFVIRAIDKKIQKTQLPVSDEKHFTQTPLLANSVQQFGMWVLAASKMIKHSKHEDSVNLSFTVDCGDAIAFCQTMLQFPSKFAHLVSPVTCFDAIYTSNLLDHLSPPALILMCASVLKPTGTLFSTTLRYRAVGFAGSEYFTKFFGFPPELFPVLLGIRCIGHDGQYSSDVSAQPIPCNPTLHSGFIISYSQIPKLLVWQKVSSEPLRIATLEECKALCSALCDASIAACACPIKPETNKLFQNLSVEAFLIVLHHFMSHLHPAVPATTYKFWEPLCQMISQKSEMKPHLLQLQTQSLLHGLHLHFILSEEDCPVCNDQPVQDFIGQCSVSIAGSAMAQHHGCPIVVNITTADHSNVNCITSLAGYAVGSKLTLHFFLPKYITDHASRFEVTTSTGPIAVSCLISTGSLQDVPWCTPQYVFLNTYSQHDAPQESPLGEISKHIGDASSFSTVVLLSDACLTAKEVLPLKTHQILTSQLQMKCGDTFQLTIQYPYPIEYSKVRTKSSSESRTSTVLAPRATNVFYDECPTFLVDPSNRMALPPNPFSHKTIQNYCEYLATIHDTDEMGKLKDLIYTLFDSYAEGIHVSFYHQDMNLWTVLF